MYKERLVFLRNKDGIIQRDIANIISIHEGRYSQYETENDIFPLKHLNTVCNYFEVSMDYILGFSNVKQYKDTKKEINQIIVGERLKSFRKEKKLTQVKLAEILGTVHPTVVNYENGKHLIATSFLYTICKKYKISADYLLGKIDEPKYLN